MGNTQANIIERHRLQLAELPQGLRQLYKVGQQLAVRDSRFPDHFRVVVSVPTQRLASTALALGAITTDWGCDQRCSHRVHTTERHKAACYLDKKLRDVMAWVSDDGEQVYAGPQSSFPSSHGIHLLPPEFPEREPEPRGQQFEEQVGALYEFLGCIPTEARIAGMERSELGVHPVLVVGYVSESIKDTRMPGSPLNGLCPIGLLAPGKFGSATAPGWYRHPVLLARSLRDPVDGFMWLKHVQPRLVVYVGMNPAIGSFRGIWPRTPAVVLLSRRSRSSANALEVIQDTLGWRPEILNGLRVESPLLPNNGLEVSYWSELSVKPPDANDEEEPEW